MLTLLLFVTSTVGEVQMPGAAEQERFKAYFTQGETLYQQGDYGAAIWNFRQADSIRITPEVAFDLAKCHEKINDVAFATYYYRQYLKRAPNASDALDVAERVGNVLARAEGEGRGLLEVQSPGAIDLTVNKAWFAEAPVAMFLPPGEYELQARFPSGLKTMVAQIRTGKTTPISFEPMPPPLLDASGAGELVAQGPSKPINKLRLFGFAGTGLGVVGLAIGIPYGISSVNNAARCCSATPDKSLNASQIIQVKDAANSQAVIGNTANIIGGIALGLGIALLVISFVVGG